MCRVDDSLKNVLRRGLYFGKHLVSNTRSQVDAFGKKKITFRHVLFYTSINFDADERLQY